MTRTGLLQRLLLLTRLLTLRQRLALFVLSVGILGFALLAWLSVYSVRSAAERASLWTLQTAALAAQQVDGLIREGTETVERLATWPGIAAALAAHWKGTRSVSSPWVTLQYLSAGARVFRDCMFVTDRHGVVRWTRPPGLGLLGTDLSGDPELRRILEGSDVHVSGVVTGGFWPGPHMLIGRSIRDEDGEAVGAIGGIVNLADFSKILGGLDLEMVRPLDVYVADGAGSVVAALRPDSVLTRIRPTILEASREGEQILDLEDEGKVAAVQPLGTIPGSVVIEEATAEFNREAETLKAQLEGAGAVLLLLVVSILLLIAASVIRPLRELTVEARRIASGDLSRPIPAQGRDEIYLLAASLEGMREQLLEDQTMLREKVAELGEMNRLKSEFIANLSHEFRTSVQIITGYLDLVLEGSFGDVPEDLRPPLEKVLSQHRALFELLQICMQFASIDVGKETERVESFDLADTVRVVFAQYEAALRAKGLRGSVAVAAESCAITSDRERVRRVLRSLVDNAVKFTEGGEVAVSVAPAADGRSVAVRVRDTGIGIDETYHQVIFERFRQVDGSTTRRFGGLGVGLAIAKELVQFLDGTLSVESQLGKGSTFTATLPRSWSPRAGAGFECYSDRSRPPRGEQAGVRRVPDDGETEGPSRRREAAA